MTEIIEVEGHRAAVSFDPPTGMLGGEFLELTDGADFYTISMGPLREEGRKSSQTYLELCTEKGIDPFPPTDLHGPRKVTSAISPQSEAAGDFIQSMGDEDRY